MGRLGIERGEVLLSLQLILTKEEEAARRAGAWQARAPVSAPPAPNGTAVRPRPALSRIPSPPPAPIVMVDPNTGAGTLQALYRDLGIDPTWRVTEGATAVVAVGFDGLDQIRLVLGMEAAEEVVRSLVDVAPFALRARDRVYRSGRDQLMLVLPEADEEGVESARAGLEGALGRFLADRQFPEVRLTARRVDPASLAG